MPTVDTVVSERLGTGISEFDRVLGGGIVPGSLVLLGGEPGIGKSTLLLQAAAHFAAHVGPVLYCSGEESEHQIKMRGERLGVAGTPLYLLAETCVERLIEEVDRLKPALLIVDSIQTVFSLKMQSAPGSVSQVRQAATDLLFTAKGRNLPTILVGHVTKDGSLAGPKVLEHVVDTVLYFEGEQHHAHRVVRAVKNRFGAVSELGVFEMTGTGFAARAESVGAVPRRASDERAGSVVLCTIEGSRPILVEVQALVSASTFGNARRTASGLDQNRLSLLLAVLDKRAGLNLVDRRRVRERRGRHDGRRAGGGPGRGGGGGVEPAQSAVSVRRRGLRRGRPGRRGARDDAGGAAGPGGRAARIHPLRRARRQRRARDVPAGARGRRRPDRRARRSTPDVSVQTRPGLGAPR